MEGRKALQACRRFLKEEHASLLPQLEELETSWKQEEQQGA
jgi:hypothetical protein